MKDSIECAVVGAQAAPALQKIKGHTTIELTDVHTGEIERYEDDNMFTQAIEKMVNFALTHGGYQCGVTDFFSDQYWKTMMGGLLLFNTSIDSDALYQKAGNKMVGCGAIDYTNSNPALPQMGTYNAAESDTSQPLTKKFVYDFATSQANGTIASVCLTSYNSGFSGAGAKAECFDNGNNNRTKVFSLAYVLQHAANISIQATNNNQTSHGVVNESFLIFCVDSDNDLMYAFSVRNDKLVIATYAMRPGHFSLFQTMSDVNPSNVEEYAGKYEGSYFYYFYNTDEKRLYFWLAVADTISYRNNAEFTVYQFDMDKKEVSTHCTFRNLSGDDLFRNIVFTQKTAYAVKGRSPCAIYKIDLDSMRYTLLDGDINNANVCTVNNAYIYNGIITWGNMVKDTRSGRTAYNDVIVDTSDDEVRYTGSAIYINREIYTYDTIIVPPIDNSQLVYAVQYEAGISLGSENGFLNSYGDNDKRVKSNTWAPNNYLATINNLGSPVEKTAEKTMKVTYTITAEEG